MTIANLTSILLTKFAAKRRLVRMQWHNELSMEFMPAAYRPLLQSDAVFDWPMQYGVTSWLYCSICGRRTVRKQNAAIGAQFECQKTIVSVCPTTFLTGCSHGCYRQRDVDTIGATPINATYELQSILQ